MSERKPPPSEPPSGKGPRETEKAARLAAALRANLARRKAQRRERGTGAPDRRNDEQG
ncbi:hypothetical protein [uncultured Amaricoccus sp.]|uniref:hypothetical protein n=1 Tax=uncultured Amaricoccus sp. TaxID=339341 RepID=UPI0026168A8A|nr:hypothetical protein [uncultured Amaricoccus sp.]